MIIGARIILLARSKSQVKRNSLTGLRRPAPSEVDIEKETAVGAKIFKGVSAIQGWFD